MVRFHKKWIVIMTVTIGLLLLAVTGWAAPEPLALQQIRFTESAESVRIVFDLNGKPTYKVMQLINPVRIVVDIDGAVNKSGVTQMSLKDPFIQGIRVGHPEPGKLRFVIDCKLVAAPKVFTLTNPDRLVIDLAKIYEHKNQDEIQPGLTYTSWVRGRTEGPVGIYILELNPMAGFALKPALSNDMIPGIEPLTQISNRYNATAAVNGSYFASNGEIIGLLKIDGEIVSTSRRPRTAAGILNDGRLVIDQVDYQGTAMLPENIPVAISGVNYQRPDNELILYNRHYGQTTSTGNSGAEYTIIADTVVSIQNGNSAIPTNGVVLSAHGTAAKKLAHVNVGDRIHINQTLGKQWDETVHALGAGPMLVKDGSIYLTTKIEEFGADVAGGRAPRTAIGVKPDGKILLVVVDGRQSRSVGFSLLELAILMQELGAVQAMNLDGGGSSEIIVNQKVMNKPSDGRERQVGSGLLVVPHKLAI